MPSGTAPAAARRPKRQSGRTQPAAIATASLRQRGAYRRDCSSGSGPEIAEATAADYPRLAHGCALLDSRAPRRSAFALAQRGVGSGPAATAEKEVQSVAGP